ncbi:MAG: energy-coupling factor transporter transmembrane component T family protein [Coriobacteriales bacterium]
MMATASVSFGQYLPGTSLVHRLDARVKLGVSVLLVYAVFASDTWPGVAFCLGVCLLGYLVARVPPRLAARAVRPLLVISLFTIIVNAFTFHASDFPEALVLFGSFALRVDGLELGVFLAARIVLVVLAASLVTFTTTPVALTDAFAALMRPLRVLHVPVEDVSTMLSLSMRLVPVCSAEARKVTLAQRARGMRFDEGGLMRRVKAWTPVVVALLAGLFRRSDELADAMDARCYTGVGRTHLRVYRIGAVDVAVLAVAALSCIAVGVLF